MRIRTERILLSITALWLVLGGPAVGQTPGVEPIDPEDQPRTYHVVDLTDAKNATLVTDALRLGARGAEVLPADDGGPGLGRLQSGVEAFDFPANAVSVLWREDLPRDTHIEIEIATSRDGVTWGRWYTVERDPHSVGTIRERLADGRPNPNHGFNAGSLLSWGLERFLFFRYRVTLLASADASPVLSGLRFFYQDTTLDGRPPSAPKAGGFGQPAVCDRTCWAARAPQCSISQLSEIDRAVIHHTATETDWATTSEADSAANVRAHQNFHMDGRGWCDVGYNFLVDKLGHRFEGREGSLASMSRGAHDGVNQNSIGVALMGFMHAPHNQTPTLVMRDAAYDLIAWKVEDPFDGYGSGTYGALSGIGRVAGHRDVASTVCPGDQMYPTYIGTDFFGGEARDSVNARITGPSIPCCPDTPVLESVTSDGNGNSITVRWSDVGLVSAYHVFTSSDAVNWSGPAVLASGTTSYTDSGLATGTARYYRVTSVGSSQESAASDVYGAVVGTATSSVLIVDGNDRWVFQTSENPSGANHDFATYAGLAMGGMGFDTVDNDAVENGAFALGGYDAVIWLLGEESTAQESFSPAEQSAVASYLDAGGKLFVSGAEIGWDLVAKGGTADRTFYESYLKASYVADDANTFDVDAEPGGLFDGLASMSFAGGPMNIGFPDEIAVFGGSQPALGYATGGLAGVSFDGTFDVVHFGFPFESLDDPADRAAVMGRVLDFFLGASCTVEEDFENGAPGWFVAASSTCTTGDYVVGAPTLMTNSGVTTQIGSSYNGSGSVFTASNTSAGVNDVDSGNCVLGSPTWAVSAASTLSVAWWHGQRDSGDDAGDFFRLEYSTDGGTSWTVMASNGDVQSQAAWTVATASVPAGADVEVRVQCADGAGPGDLIECGIDAVRICR